MTELDLIEVQCRYTFTIFKNDAFRICRYEYLEKPEGESRRDFVAKGNDLPETRNVNITLMGNWNTSGKDRSFAVSGFKIALPSSEEGVIEYLSSLKCGIGKVRAKAIYKYFGENVWFIIENQPERLEEVGLEHYQVSKLIAALQKNQIQMKVAQMFVGSKVPFHRLNKLIKHFGANTINILRDNPYAICQVEGFSFMLADSLAAGRVDPTNIERRKAAVIASLDAVSMEGHVCYPRADLIKKMMRLLNANKDHVVTEDMCEAAIIAATSEKLVACSAGFVYTIERHHQEARTAKELARLMYTPHETYNDDYLNTIIAQYEQENSITMADSQKDAVKCAMNNQVSVMTGGPGTGKSTTAKAILYCHKAIFGEESNPVCLLAPTGKAARRLAESTNYPASTIDSAIRLDGEEEGEDGSSAVSTLEGNIILVDESSMVDQYRACELVRRVATGAKLVFVGDPNQLPSVGCGNVLLELIRSTAVPTVKLSVIFRQAAENPIVGNAEKILNGDTNLNYTPSFQLIEVDEPGSIFVSAAKLYLSSVRKYGIDSTILLCPYRKSTDLNVNLFNINLQKVLNPKRDGELTMNGRSVFIKENKSVPLEFRTGDKVMMTVNTKEAKNGDTGFIRSIVRELDPTNSGSYRVVAKVAFNGDEENLVTIDGDRIRDLDLAYCSSVHKSQGEEYKNVIMVMSSLHKQMLKRNLFYTGITRAKQNVVLVGEVSAVATAIKDVDTTKRYTLLADRLYAEQQKHQAQVA